MFNIVKFPEGTFLKKHFFPAGFLEVLEDGRLLQNRMEREHHSESCKAQGFFFNCRGCIGFRTLDCWIVSLVLPIASCLIVVDDQSFRDQYPECFLGMFPILLFTSPSVSICVWSNQSII